jgi:hypothetical protein
MYKIIIYFGPNKPTRFLFRYEWKHALNFFKTPNRSAAQWCYKQRGHNCLQKARDPLLPLQWLYGLIGFDTV